MGCVQSLPDTAAAGGISQTNSAANKEDALQAAAVVCGGNLDFTSQVEINISCRSLPNLDVASKSDPIAVLYQSEGWGKRNWCEQDRSDVVRNSQDPDFSCPLRVRYTFEVLQPMRVVLFDVDTAAAAPKDLDLSKQDYIGEAEFLLSDLMTAPTQTLQLQLKSSKRNLPPGCVAVLRAEELANSSATVRLGFSARDLENKDRFSKSDPFLRVQKLREGGDWVPVLKTEVVDNNLHPAWRPIEVDIRQLCNADEHRPLRLEVFDYDSSGSHDLIGQCQSSLGQLRGLAAAPSPTLDLAHPSKPAKCTGVLSLRELTVKPRPSFLQYIAGGCQVSFMVAIDFTASNGDPRKPQSLHYLSPMPTQYEQVITAVGQVLERYDTDRRFPVWGFGAGLPPSGAVSHCFSLSSNHSQPEVQGIQGILEAYRSCLTNIRLSGPTLFEPIIRTAAGIARHQAESPSLGYFVLLIMTDGAIMDMASTKAAIVEASGLPLSILIVGVGDADFSAMEELDSDKKTLRVNGLAAYRDIVQFVPLRETQRKGGAEAVARELLAEIPGQLVGYFDTLRKVQPPPLVNIQTVNMF